MFFLRMPKSLCGKSNTRSFFGMISQPHEMVVQNSSMAEEFFCRCLSVPSLVMRKEKKQQRCKNHIKITVPHCMNPKTSNCHCLIFLLFCCCHCEEFWWFEHFIYEHQTFACHFRKASAVRRHLRCWFHQKTTNIHIHISHSVSFLLRFSAVWLISPKHDVQLQCLGTIWKRHYLCEPLGGAFWCCSW